MRPAEAYGGFAWAYDPALGSRFFRAIEPRLDRLIARAPIPSLRHLDVACGSGLAVEWFAARGFESVGLDASLPMLSMASARGGKLVAGDMRAIPLRGEFGIVTSLYDSLNHLLSRGDLVATFRSIASVMAAGGIFFFDVNHPEVYRRVWAVEEPYESSDANHLLIMKTRFSETFQRGVAEISGWAEVGGRRRKIRETRRQRAWGETAIREALGKTGLECMEVVPFDPWNEDDEEPAKLIFIARKSR
ncbi:MAG TPA: methyltransferase domain-containing protein [Thermoanaerobaculia bacterium]|nr:methyltransferase domain-containing protein [Thermoanaerobaculia bacterium]